MKILPFLMLLACPLSIYAETEEIELDDEKEKPTNPPLKRSYAPKPKLFLVDRAEIQIEVAAPATDASISIRDEQNTVVFQANYFSTSYSVPVLENTQTYSISLYLDGRQFSGTILP